MTKIMQLLQQHCQFPHMQQKVEIYIKKCFNCQRNKHTTHAEYDEIQYVKSSIKAWNETILNFIIKLSKSQDFVIDQHYDVIFVIIDRFTKYTHSISFCEDYKAKQLKYVILNRLIRYYRIFKELTSDRDKLFTFKYWQTFILILGTRLRLFTAYHLRTDEQTERINQILKQYLYHYVNYHQDNWVELLSMTQIAMNNKVSNTTKISLYFVNFDKESNLFKQELEHVAADLIINWVKRLKNIKDNIQKMQLKFEKYVNKKRKKDSQLKEKDKIYLLTKNLTIKRLNKKLNYTKIGSFFIKAIKKSVNYELSLLKNTRIHSIFHINVLESADLNIFI